MKPTARYKVVDGPLAGARAVYGCDERVRAELTADNLNRINLLQDGPWGYGRYWVDDQSDLHRGTTITDLETIVDNALGEKTL